MIVDMHTHLWQTPEQLGPQICELLRDRLAQPLDAIDAGPQAHEEATRSVDVAVVAGFKSRHLGADVPNDLIADYVATRPNRLVGFAGIDPMIDGVLEEIDDAVAAKLAGVTLSPAGQNFHPEHTRAMAVYEKCQELGLPLLVQQGTHFTRDFRLEYARPWLFDEVARTFPELRIIIGHCGFPWPDEALVLLGKHKHVYAELSNVIARPWQLYNVLLQAHQLQVTDRLLFGSDYPYNTPERAIETIYSLNRFSQGTGLPGVPREKVRAIVERDALAALGLMRGSAPSGGGGERPAPRPSRSRVEETSG